MAINHRIGRKRSRENAGRPSPKEQFTTGVKLFYDEHAFVAKFCEEHHITKTQFFESCIEMVRNPPTPFKLYENPNANRNYLKPVESKLSA